MGLDREKMPQIPKNKIKEFREFCEFEYDPQYGIPSEDCGIPVKSLKSIQKHVNKGKIQSIIDGYDGTWQPLLVSEEGYILDGNHRWVAAYALNPEGNIPCIRFKCPITELLRAGHEFEGSFTKSVKENATYTELAKLLWIK
jgi:hypothetical protein